MDGMESLDMNELEQHTLTCKMFLGKKFYDQLSDKGKEVFECTSEGIYATFQAILEDGITLGNCIMSFTEVAYIGLNPKYEINEDTTVKCELYKNGKDDTTFSLLVTITYKNDKEPYHELLVFAQRKLTETEYSFELVGDQTMFAM